MFTYLWARLYIKSKSIICSWCFLVFFYDVLDLSVAKSFVKSVSKHPVRITDVTVVFLYTYDSQRDIIQNIVSQTILLLLPPVNYNTVLHDLV